MRGRTQLFGTRVPSPGSTMQGPPEVEDDAPNWEALSRIGELGKSVQEPLQARDVTQVPVGVPPVPGLMSPNPASPFPKLLPLPLLPPPGGNVSFWFAVAHAAASAMIPATTAPPKAGEMVEGAS